MKISVSIPDDGVAFVDAYAAEHATSRSAAVYAAIDSLRRIDLAAEYEAAFQEWEDSGEAVAWDSVAEDGIR